VSQQRKKGDLYTFGFAIVICVVCSLVLSLAATALKPRQVANAKLDTIQNLLSAVGYDLAEVQAMPPEEVFEIYDREIEIELLDKNNQAAQPEFMRKALIRVGYPEDQVSEMDTATLLDKFNAKVGLLAGMNNQSREEYDPGYKILYVHTGESGQPDAYVIPIVGYGLWDIIKGYIALEPDLNTVKGISFYEHKETPGLGARITEDWFKKNYIGKKILDEGDLVSVKVAKGRVDDVVKPEERKHYVDGISGATLTGKGINQFLEADLSKYEPYFKTLRRAGKERT
jgi:Na+-transporting NADH:ubiquinone oxidoreductase subunit C